MLLDPLVLQIMRTQLIPFPRVLLVWRPNPLVMP